MLCVFGVCTLYGPERALKGDQAILPSIQLLTGIGLVLMISLRDPLRDTLAFANFAEGICGGCCLLLLLSFLDFESLLGKFSFIPLLLSLVLSTLLLGLGHGPGASGTQRVNLQAFQPVEVIKILLIFLFGQLFCAELGISAVSEGQRSNCTLAASWDGSAAPRLRVACLLQRGPSVAVLLSAAGFGTCTGFLLRLSDPSIRSRATASGSLWPEPQLSSSAFWPVTVWGFRIPL